MNIAEKLTVIAENEQKVYEAGKQAECNEFWDNFQNYGNRTEYKHAFRTSCWNDDIYNPKYPLTISESVSMYETALVTDTKVDIIATDLNNTFYYANKLETIRNLILLNDVEVGTATFRYNNALKNVNVTGEGRFLTDINMQHSNLLTVKSMNNVIAYLKDYSGTNTTCTLTLHVDAKARLSESEIAVATQKGWTIA